MKTKIKPSLLLIILFISTLFAGSCSFSSTSNLKSDTFWDDKKQLMLWDFEEENVSPNIEIVDSDVELTNKGVTQGSKALEITFKGDEPDPGVIFKPETPIDASQFKNFCIVFDATNLTKTYSTQLLVTIVNEYGESTRRSSVIPVGATKTFYAELAGKYINGETGLRDDPKPWDNNSDALRILGLKNKVNFSKIASIHIKVAHPIADKTVVFVNILFVESPPIDD